jgi:chemotaxis protein MotA
MWSHSLGVILAIAVVSLPIFVMGGDHRVFLSIEALLIVILGTVSIAFIAYPFRHIKHLVRVVGLVLRSEGAEGPLIAEQVVKLSLSTRGDRNLLQSEVNKIQDPFLKDGVTLIIEKSDENLEQFLMDRIQTKKSEDEHVINMIRKLGTFPPALGLLATVLSLVHLLQNMGSSGGIASLGPTMAVGLVGTLYGIVVANLFFAPIAENLSHRSSQDLKSRKVAMVGLLLLQEKRSASLVQDAVNSVLRPEQRVSIIGKGG